MWSGRDIEGEMRLLERKRGEGKERRRMQQETRMKREMNQKVASEKKKRTLPNQT